VFCIYFLRFFSIMKQETVCAIPVELFSISDGGASTSKGACVCAVVVLPSRPPKYSLVCYNAQQVTFCVARMSWVDGRNTSLQLVVAPSGHVSFCDDTNQRWSLFFDAAAQLTRFVACVGVAFYALYGAPVTSVFAQDLSLPSSSLPLAADDRASVSFTGFELREKDGVCSVGAVRQQRDGHDSAAAPYVFQPKLSTVELNQGCFGFEGNVIGMREDDRRVFVVPAGYTTRVADSLTSVAAEGAVYVVQLLRVEHVDDKDDAVNRKGKAAQKENTGAAASAAVGAAPPAVYAETADPASIDSSRVRALTVVSTSNAVAAPHDVPTAVSAVPAFLSPGGIPSEHMSVLRKVELGVNAAVTSARDVRDVAAIFSQEWHRYVERPKPSVLSNKALLEQIQRVVEEEETAQTHLDECDRLLQVLDARNKELQQRIDLATVESQKLLEEKHSSSTRAMDARLEKDRQLVRLKDSLLLKKQEREDLQRHINALQRALDVSNEELRQVQGKCDVHLVEVNSMAERLAAMQETLSEERHRNAALTTKTAATEESLKKAQVQQRLAEGQLTTARGLAEKERLRYVQIMEEERHHRAQDSELLRQDILHELDARDRQYQVDRRRIAEEEFSRGLRDGKAEGRQAAETDLLGHHDELRLNLQRAKTEVETIKEEVRRSIESAMALRRTLGGKVSEMEEQLATATRRQAQLRFQVAQWQTRCRTVRDTVGEHWRTLISYATHPCTRAELLAMMKAVRAAEERSYADGAEGDEALVRVDLQFQSELWQQSRRKSIEQRLRWLSEDMEDMYVKGASYHFEHEWEQPVTEAHAATLETVAQLYAQLHGSRKLFDLCVQEAQERYAKQQQWWIAVTEIEGWIAAQRKAQEAVKADETQARKALWKAFMDGGDVIVQLCAAQLRAQVLLLQGEMQDRDEVVAEESRLRRHLPIAAQQMWVADCAAALHVLEEEEEAVRAGLEAEAYTAISGIRFQFAYAQRGVEEAVVQRTQQQQLYADEGAARADLEREETAERERILCKAAAALAPAPPPLTTHEEVPPVALPVVAAATPPAPRHPLAHETSLSESAEEVKTNASAGPVAQRTTQSANAATAAATVPAENLLAAMDGAQEVASQHADPAAPSPSPPPPAVPAFTLTDPPRVGRVDPARKPTRADEDESAGQSPGNVAVPRSATGAPREHLNFPDEPPPLPPSDDEDKTKATAEEKRSADELGHHPAAQAAPSISPCVVPRPGAPPAKPESSAAALLYAGRDAPPPLPVEDDEERAPPQPNFVSESSESDASSSPSSAAAASPTAGVVYTSTSRAYAAPPLSPPPPRPRPAIAAIEVDDEAAAAASAEGSEPAPATAKDPKYMFGASSSEDESDSDDHQEPAASAPRRAASMTGPAPPSAVSALTKPRLFDSSDDD
jgi:hypothetical protein